MNDLTLKECCTFQEGYVNPSQKVRDYFDGPIKWLRASDLNDSLVFNTEKTLSVRGFESAGKSAYLFPKDSIAISKSGTIGRLGILKDNMCGNRAVINIKVDAKIADIKYIFYTLKYKKNEILKKAEGSIQKNLYVSALETISLNHKYKQDQQKIASVLSALDNKIELNNRINAELEAMAKTIYDYWFVQFDSPDKNGKPYKSSGGKMVWSEELKREVPDNWEKLILGDVVESTGTGLNPRDNFTLGTGNNYYVTIKNIEQGRVILDNKCDRINDEALEIINKRSDLRVGDILFTSIEPVGITYLILEKPKNWNINESVFTIRPNYDKVTSEFLYMFLSGDYIKSYTKNVAAGSIHKGVRHSVLKDCKFILPAKEIINQFTEIINPILNKIDLIEKENQQLTSLRDWLLPMLMNGQVKVN
jgi:type I restriction enzyme S subunit